ncbi:hypothetical protein TcWFU_006177 [Taenia crassiceps]|uniref:MRG domain-containing protein n=1 Tax=Taenia crassiceps TaxID=6207 RepID=A0ABR4QI88_9CEST
MSPVTHKSHSCAGSLVVDARVFPFILFTFLVGNRNGTERMLKQKIDELAIKIKDKEKRKERIDTVLMSAAKARDDVDWDSLPGTWQKDEQLSKTRAPNPSLESSQSQPQLEPLEETELDPDSLAQSNFESLEAHTNFAPKIKLPDTLYAILESHCRPYEMSRGSSVRPLVPVPSWCSVLHLLQTYLNGFPYFMSVNNSMGLNRGGCRSVHKDRQDVRILFDALLEEYLLYPNEEKKHSNGLDLPPKSQLNILPSEEIAKNPLLPCLVYDAIYILRLIVRLPALINQMSLTKCRRSIVLRHLYLFIAYLDATRDFWFTASRPDLAAPILPSLVSKSISTDAAATLCGVKHTEMRSGPSTTDATVTGATLQTTSSMSKKRRRVMSSEPESKMLISPPSPPPSLSSVTSNRKSANSQLRTSRIELRNLRSRGPPIPVTTTTTSTSTSLRNRNTKTTTHVKTPRQSFPQQRALYMTSSVRSQRRFTRASVTPMILRSARV